MRYKRKREATSSDRGLVKSEVSYSGIAQNAVRIPNEHFNGTVSETTTNGFEPVQEAVPYHPAGLHQNYTKGIVGYVVQNYILYV